MNGSVDVGAGSRSVSGSRSRMRSGRKEETKDGLLKTIAVAGLVWPGIDVQDIAIDREGLAWPPRPADPTKPAT